MSEITPHEVLTLWKFALRKGFAELECRRAWDLLRPLLQAVNNLPLGKNAAGLETYPRLKALVWQIGDEEWTTRASGEFQNSRSKRAKEGRPAVTKKRTIGLSVWRVKDALDQFRNMRVGLTHAQLDRFSRTVLRDYCCAVEGDQLVIGSPSHGGRDNTDQPSVHVSFSDFKAGQFDAMRAACEIVAGVSGCAPASARKWAYEEVPASERPQKSHVNSRPRRAPEKSPKQR